MSLLVDAAARRPKTVSLCCPCGGDVRLDGWEVPGVCVRYLCRKCQTVRTSLKDLVPKEIGS